MRILHTADWHLGRIFHDVHLTSDQSFVLDQLIKCGCDYKPDIIIVSGDIYDRAIPSPDAVSLLDDTIHRIVNEIQCTLLIIAGNHDSPDRLTFGSRIFASQGIHIFGKYSHPISPLILHDSHGPVYFYSIPFAEPSTIREQTHDLLINDHQSAWKCTVDNIMSIHPAEVRSVLCGHASVLGGTYSGMERPLSIGGSELVDVQIFDKFSFTALGHLHGRQWQGDTVHYAGSLMKYSFSEVSQTKSVTLVELDQTGKISSEYVPLLPRRDLRIVKGILSELLSTGVHDNSRDDYIMAVLEDKEPQLDAIGKLRQIYPNILHIERPALSPDGSSGQPVDHRKIDELELMELFFHQTTGEHLGVNHKTFLQKTIDSLRQQEREAQ